MDDLRRHKRDQEVNSQKCKRLLNDHNRAVEIVPASKLKVSMLFSCFSTTIFAYLIL